MGNIKLAGVIIGIISLVYFLGFPVLICGLALAALFTWFAIGEVPWIPLILSNINEERLMISWVFAGFVGMLLVYLIPPESLDE